MASHDIKALARSTWSNEETTAKVPEYYEQALESFLATNPMDVHFIMELGEPGKRVGGNGFGSVTCMEDYCWEDVILDADPTLPIDQQKKNGLGSFFNFKVHCQGPKHIKGRNERCLKEGKPVISSKDPFASAQTSAASHPGPQNTQGQSHPSASQSSRGPPSSQPSRHSQRDQDLLRMLDGIDEAPPVHSKPFMREPFRHTSSSAEIKPRVPSLGNGSLTTENHMSAYDRHVAEVNAQQHPPRATSSKHALQPVDGNKLSKTPSFGSERDIKPFAHLDKGKGKAPVRSMSNHTLYNDDDDDDVIELQDDNIPVGMRKNKSTPRIFTLEDDDDEDEVELNIKPKIQSSQPSTSWMATQQRIKAERDGLAHRGSSQSIQDDARSSPRPFTDLPAKFSPVRILPPPTVLAKRDIRDRYEKELTHLKSAYKAFKTGITKNDQSLAIVAKRYRDVERYRLMINTQTTWIRPSQTLLDAVPSLRALVRSFEYKLPPPPPPSLVAPDIKPNQNALAGPSTRPGVPYPAHPALAAHPHGRAYPGMPADVAMQTQGVAMPGAFNPTPYVPGDLQRLVAQFDAARAGLQVPPIGPQGQLVDIKPGLDNMQLGREAAAARMGMDMDEYDDYLNHGMYGRDFERVDNLQEFFTNSLNAFDEDQDVEGALAYLGLTSIQQRYKDLSVSLMAHQVLGVKFMIEQEKKPRMKGGILADSMGLGKTLSSIAVIVGNPSEDRKIKTTLVVAPLALLQQWKSEIESKTTTPKRVLIHWGPKRTTSPAQLKSYDVVLTTYGIMTAEHGLEKRKTKKKRLANANDSQAEEDSDEDDGSVAPALKQGPLFKTLWYRVVLDEAHMIRNRSTRASKAAWDLNAIYRWCLTGTPIMNSLVDTFSMLHFLNISPQADWKNFSSYIARIEKKSPRLATKRMQAILKTCSIRRNKESTLNGIRLLNLPEKVVTWDELELTPDERHIYTSIEQRMQIKFNALLKRGTVLKHYSMVLVMLVRLKQATSHPYLLTRRAEDAAHPDDVVVSDQELMGTKDAALLDDMKELQRALDTMGQEYVDKVAQKLEERWRDVQKQEQRGEADTQEFGLECAVCLEPYEHEHAERVTECCHSYCATCIEELWNDAPRTLDLTEAQQAKNMRQCPLCREPISREKVFRASAFFNPEEQEDIKPLVDEAGPSTGGPSRVKRELDNTDEDVKPALKKLFLGKGKGKATDYADKTPEKEEKPAVVDFNELEITPSTKMRHLLAVIQEKLQDPTVKVVAYSQFTSFLDLCGAFLRKEGVNVLQYQGSMKAPERQNTLDRFNTPTDLEGGESRVLLLSLKAGGVGLNLTISNVVIALDLAWNAATEDQAVDRCHRIGQTKEVDVRRLCVKNSIDERIRELQENKRRLADGALGEGEGGRLGRLSIGDLIRLFNVNGTGEDD